MGYPEDTTSVAGQSVEGWRSKTPFAWLAARFQLSRGALRASSLAALIAAVFIIVGGGVVRVTGSGLGCPDWPQCIDGSLGPTAEMGIHGIIEFVNRLLTVVLCAFVGWAIIAARLQARQAPQITRWAWLQFWLVLLNAVIGGITVWVKLNPYMVATHFLAATLLLTAAAVTWDKSLTVDAPPIAKASRTSSKLSYVLLSVTAVLLIIGTGVTGSGPHAGDSADVPRMGFDWLSITIVHGVMAMLAVILGVVLWRIAAAKGELMVAKKAGLFVLVCLAQGALGIIQSLTNLPEIMVVLHLVGSALVWVGAIRIVLAARGTTSLVTESVAS